jgi:hypothetical protein
MSRTVTKSEAYERAMEMLLEGKVEVMDPLAEKWRTMPQTSQELLRLTVKSAALSALRLATLDLMESK